MQEKNDTTNPHNQGPSTKAADMMVAAIIFFLGAIVISDSRRVGASWVSDGPQAGYFPFYIGLILCLASAWILLQALWSRGSGATVFVSRQRFKPVLAVLIPTAGYVAAMYFVGIYVASAFYIGGFMGWQGRFGLTKVLPVSILVPVILFLLFEVWFLIPLPKGPVEALLGY